MRMRFVGASALVFAAVAGCSSHGTNRESLGASAHAIQYGTLDKTHTFAVGVCGGSPGGCSLYCSGALIAPNLVVTARHCVEEMSANPDGTDNVDCKTSKFTTRLGADSAFWITTSETMHQSTTGWHRASKILTPTPTAACGNDLALIILNDVVAATEATPITPGIQYPITNHKIYSTTETAIGYGVLGPTLKTAGTRYIREDVGILCIPNDPDGDCYKDAKGADIPEMHDIVAESEFETGPGTCGGDSGSSAYEQLSFTAGKPISMGVLSRGGVDDPDNPITCAFGIYTRLDKWRDFIVAAATTAAKAGNYPVPAWTAPAPADPPDAGTKPAPTPSTGPLGADCKRDADCDSNLCLRAPESTGTFHCTQSCADTSDCPSGFACEAGACFAGTPVEPGAADAGPATNEATSSGSSGGGCAIGGPLADPTHPLPWRALGGAALAGLSLLRRRRGTSSRHASKEATSRPNG